MEFFVTIVEACNLYVLHFNIILFKLGHNQRNSSGWQQRKLDSLPETWNIFIENFASWEIVFWIRIC